MRSIEVKPQGSEERDPATECIRMSEKKVAINVGENTEATASLPHRLKRLGSWLLMSELAWNRTSLLVILARTMRARWKAGDFMLVPRLQYLQTASYLQQRRKPVQCGLSSRLSSVSVCFLLLATFHRCVVRSRREARRSDLFWGTLLRWS